MTFNFSKHRLRAKDAPPKPGKPVQAIIRCDDCGAEYLTTLQVHGNEIYKPCDCGSLIHIVADYNGLGNVTLFKGTLETAYKDIS